jgi:hypothetical protein
LWLIQQLIPLILDVKKSSFPLRFLPFHSPQGNHITDFILSEKLTELIKHGLSPEVLMFSNYLATCLWVEHWENVYFQAFNPSIWGLQTWCMICGGKMMVASSNHTAKFSTYITWYNLCPLWVWKSEVMGRTFSTNLWFWGNRIARMMGWN